MLAKGTFFLAPLFALSAAALPPLQKFDDGGKASRDKSRLGRYRAFIEDGRRLRDLCAKKSPARYGRAWDKRQAKRTVYATLQYLGLELTLKALPAYAKALGFEREEYQNLGENLIGNYCSVNLTSISHKKLKQDWRAGFDGTGFTLPGVEDNALFPVKLQSVGTHRGNLEREFFFAMELFKAFCSWGSAGADSIEDLRLLPPLLRHPVVMAFVFRQLAGTAVGLNERRNETYLQRATESSPLACEDFVCRKSDHTSLRRKTPHMLGTSALQKDFERLWCREFRDARYRITSATPPKIAAKIKAATREEQVFLPSVFVSLLTGVPDFLLRSEKFSEAKRWMGHSVETFWDNWARERLKTFSRNLLFEEPVSIELVDRELYFDRDKGNFRIVLDVGQGEFDRSVQRIGKVTTLFHLPVDGAFLAWAQTQMRATDVANKEELARKFRRMIGEPVRRLESALAVPIHRGALDDLLAAEILAQVRRYRGRIQPKGLVIPVEVNYGLFALKFIHHKFELNRQRLNKTPAPSDRPL